MNINVAWPSAGQWKAVGRNAISYSAGVATAFAGFSALGVGLHLFSPSDATTIGGALTTLATGVSTLISGIATIAGALSTLAGVGVAIWAARSASTPNQAKSVVEAFPGTKIVGPQALADATPGHPEIMSNTKNVVVPTTCEKV